jgi:hypothetical protein
MLPIFATAISQPDQFEFEGLIALNVWKSADFPAAQYQEGMDPT